MAATKAPRAFNSTLPQRKTPLKAKAWWKAPAPKKHPTAKPYKRSKAKGKALKAISAKRKVQVAEYTKTRREWLQRPENAYCAVCLSRCMNQPWGTLKRYIVTLGPEGIGSLLLSGAKLTPSTEVHHTRGRRGRLLCDTRFFAGTCRNCREFPHERPREARELELLAPPAEWEVYPGPEVEGFAQS